MLPYTYYYAYITLSLTCVYLCRGWRRRRNSASAKDEESGFRETEAANNTRKRHGAVIAHRIGERGSHGRPAHRDSAQDVAVIQEPTFIFAANYHKLALEDCRRVP